MKKIDYKILLLSFFFGLFIWLLDTIFDFLFFYEGTFIQLLLSDVPKHEIYIRTSFLICFIIFGLIISKYIQRTREAESLLQNVFNNVIPVCITSNDYEILLANKSYYSIFGMPNKSQKCFDSRPSQKCHTEDCPIKQISSGIKEYTCEKSISEGKEGRRSFIVSAVPYLNHEGEKTGIIETFQDITSRKKLEKEKEKLITELQEALEEIKSLSGIIPICMYCKEIRDDKGYWNQLEKYISEHSEVQFSHSICDKCMKKHYSELGDDTSPEF